MLFSDSSYSSTTFSSSLRFGRFNGEIIRFQLNIQQNPVIFNLDLEKNIDFNLQTQYNAVNFILELEKTSTFILELEKNIDLLSVR